MLSDDHADGLSNARPIAYQALATELRDSLARGQFAPARRLPTEAELSTRYGVGRQTVRRALQELVAEGLVLRVRGSGTYATPPVGGAQYVRSFGSIDDLLALSEDTTMEIIRPLERRAAVDAASRLQLSSDHVTTCLLRRLHENVPFCATEVFLPPQIGRAIVDGGGMPAIGERRRVTIITLVDASASQPIVAAHQSISAATSPPDVAGLIGQEPGDAVLKVDRLYIDAGGVPVELAISYFNPERYSYRLELRRSYPADT